MATATSTATRKTPAKTPAKVAPAKTPAKTSKPATEAPVTVWTPVEELAASFHTAAGIETEQAGIWEAAQLASENARALKARLAWLVAAHPDGKSNSSKTPTNASYASRVLGVPRKTLELFIAAGQNTVTKGAVDLSAMLAPVTERERETVNAFYAAGIAAKRREERAKVKAAKVAKEAATDSEESGDQSPASDGVNGALVVAGLKIAAGRIAEFKSGKMSTQERTEALAYAARIAAWAEDVAADAAAS